jgi:hypothetical protein
VHPAVVTNIINTDDSISFDVDPETVTTRSPVLVKTSYFPNWQAVGANGPWRVTPNLMVVIPTSTHVLLHYGFTPVDNAGRLASLAGLVAVGSIWWWDRRVDPASEPDAPSPTPGLPFDPRPTSDDPWAGSTEPMPTRRPGPWADEPDPSPRP